MFSSLRLRAIDEQLRNKREFLSSKLTLANENNLQIAILKEKIDICSDTLKDLQRAKADMVQAIEVCEMKAELHEISIVEKLQWFVNNYAAQILPEQEVGIKMSIGRIVGKRYMQIKFTTSENSKPTSINLSPGKMMRELISLVITLGVAHLRGTRELFFDESLSNVNHATKKSISEMLTSEDKLMYFVEQNVFGFSPKPAWYFVLEGEKNDEGLMDTKVISYGEERDVWNLMLKVYGEHMESTNLTTSDYLKNYFGLSSNSQ